uniref:Uncharacterized protein n=1 Tax=Arundo donax TaxID=35708 RepID=A0A0A9AZB6_ARUDO
MGFLINFFSKHALFLTFHIGQHFAAKPRMYVELPFGSHFLIQIQY